MENKEKNPPPPSSRLVMNRPFGMDKDCAPAGVISSTLSIPWFFFRYPTWLYENVSVKLRACTDLARRRGVRAERAWL